MADPERRRKAVVAAWTHSEAAAQAVTLAEEQVRLDPAEGLGLAAHPEGPPDDGCPEAERVCCRVLRPGGCPVALAYFLLEPDGCPELTAVVPGTRVGVYYLDAHFHSEPQPRRWGS